MPKCYVTLSIVTYNSEQYIKTVLDSLFENIKGVDYHIYVVDNFSTDNTAQIVKSMVNDKLTFINNDNNLGFGGGHNKALELCDSKYHAFVNPDVFIKDDVLSDMAKYLDDNPDIGILTPKVLFPDGQIQVLPQKNPRFIYLVARRIHLGFLKKHREEFEMFDKGLDTKHDIEFATGAFMFTRTDLVKKVGGFDERFFLYFEDADITRKINEISRAEYNPDFTVYHYWERAGSKKIKFFLIQIASMFKYMSKWRKSNKSK